MSDPTELYAIGRFSMAELWDMAFVAESEDEAVAQAHRQYGLVVGKPLCVDRITYLFDGSFDERYFLEPYPLVRVRDVSTEPGWDGEVLYPEWTVIPVDPDQIVTTHDGVSLRLGDIEEPTTTPPGIGTEDGFGRKDHLVFPVHSEQDRG